MITTGVTTSGPKSVTNQIVYEHRIGSRGQYEVAVPIDMQQAEDGGSWSRGLGDIELAIRRTFFHSVDRGSIFAAGAAVALPTGKEERGLGNGYTIVEPFAMFGQMLGSDRLPAGAHAASRSRPITARAKTKRSCARRSVIRSRRIAASAGRGRR